MIQWGGAIDDGLINVRPNVVLWGTDLEVRQWDQLKDVPNNVMTDLEISVQVLREN